MTTKHTQRHQTASEITLSHNSVDISKRDAEFRKLMAQYKKGEISFAELQKRDPSNSAKPENRSLLKLLIKGSAN